MEIPRHWRLKTQRYRLVGSVCLNCGQFSFPPRPVCPHRTTQATRFADGRLLVLQVPIGKTEIISPIGYRITERMTG